MTVIEERAMRAPASPPAQSPAEDEISKRIVIWAGDITTLDVDVIVNPTDETLMETNPVSSRIMLAAGPDLKEHLLTKGYECRPCEAIVTAGYGLRCSHIIHSACPKYCHQQHHASLTALHNCYTNIMYKAWSLGARSVALVGVPPRGHYPPDAHQHVIRTIRKFLSSHQSPSLVLVAGVQPLSPRPHVRIIRNPATATQSEDDTSFDSELASEAAALFRADTQRLLPSPRASPRLTACHHDDTYERLLRRAHSTDLSSVSGIGCLYQSGVDRLGRPVVVFIGKWFPIADVDLDKALLYLIKLLDPIVRGDYVIAYFHTLASSHNHPPFAWLKQVYTVLPYKYKKNLKAFYIVHPTFWTKMMTWWFTTFMAPAIKAKVHNLPGVEFLYSVMARDQLEVPAFVTEYDMTINGLHYFQPDTNNT